MNAKDKIKATTGFKGKDGNTDSNDLISKEETMFKVDNSGKIIPENYPIYIYDRDLDKELIDEGLQLMTTLQRTKSSDKILQEEFDKHNKNIEELKKKRDKEKDSKKKFLIEKEINDNERILISEDLKSKINKGFIDDGIKQSREILKELNEKKKSQKVTKYVELIPCTISESYNCFEKSKTIDGKDTDDWISDLITNKITKPKYTLKEVKLLRPDYKIALKEALMSVSNYRIKSYRDVMMEIKLKEDKPLTLKKS